MSSRAGADRAFVFSRCAADASLLQRLTAPLLIAAAAVYAITVLYLTRGAVPTFDSMAWLTHATSGFAPADLVEPHNGHLIAVTRLLYAGTLRVFGTEPVIFELALIAAVVGTAIVLFLLLRKRLAAPFAAAAAVLTMFLGTTSVVIEPTVAVFAQSTAFGLGALLALERDDRLGDGLASALLVAGVLAFTIGLAFVVGAGLMIVGAGWRRRAWIVIVPTLIYAAWFAWAGDLSGASGSLAISNGLDIPAFSADALASGLAAVSGLGGDLSATGAPPGLIAIGWGRVLVVALVAALLLRARSGELSRRSVALIGVAVATWSMEALATGIRSPQLERYAFPTAVIGILLAADLLPPFALNRRTMLAALLVFGFALLPNLYQLRAKGSAIREMSALAKADLGTIELERDRVDPAAGASDGLLLPVSAGDYLRLGDEYGFVGSSPDELEAASEQVRTEADRNLVRILGIAAVPMPSIAAGGCAAAAVSGGSIELPSGGAVVRSGSDAEIRLRRFGDAFLDPMRVIGGVPTTLSIPTDSTATPWIVSVSGPARVRICALQATS